MSVVEEYLKRKNIIQQRLREFSCVRHEGEERLFYELCFCLLTPQSKGKQCWSAVGLLMHHDFFHRRLSARILERFLRQKTRFHVTKVSYLLKMKREFPAISHALAEHTGGAPLRLWLVKHVKGMGLKEASHFLRNIGFRNLAILDRHVLKRFIRIDGSASVKSHGSASFRKRSGSCIRPTAPHRDSIVGATHIQTSRIDG